MKNFDNFWAIKDEKTKKFTHIYPSKIASKMCGENPVEVLVSEATSNTDYWGWYDFKDKKIRFIKPSFTQFKMCFPYGYQELEIKKEGKAIMLKIEEKNG